MEQAEQLEEEWNMFHLEEEEDPRAGLGMCEADGFLAYPRGWRVWRELHQIQRRCPRGLKTQEWMQSRATSRRAKRRAIRHEGDGVCHMAAVNLVHNRFKSQMRC